MLSLEGSCLGLGLETWCLVNITAMFDLTFQSKSICHFHMPANFEISKTFYYRTQCTMSFSVTGRGSEGVLNQEVMSAGYVRQFQKHAIYGLQKWHSQNL